MTVDEILIGHEYLDRRGRRWQKLIEPTGWVNMSEHRFLTRNQMRLLVERDQHRDVCPGLIDCDNHPAPSVLLTKGGELEFLVFGPRQVRSIRAFDYHSEAMDAARALAVSE